MFRLANSQTERCGGIHVFFTTKPESQDTGLGLRICQQMIDEHQGPLNITRRHDEWTRVKVELPMIKH